MNRLSKSWPLSYLSGSLLAASLLLTACNSDSNSSTPTPAPTPEPTPTVTNDWHQKVVYQVFVRSFYDSDGDGTGDLAGVTEKIDYLQD